MDAEKLLRNFKIGFWHPFGPHAGETTDEIIKRKKAEIAQEGYTYWAFQHRGPQSVCAWREQIAKYGNAVRVVVLCADSRARDPAGVPGRRTRFADKYEVPRLDWQGIPPGIRVTHPGNSETCCAFAVKRVIDLKEPRVPTGWVSQFISRLGQWRHTDFRIVTRGETLIARQESSKTPLRRVSALLQLRSPFVVWLA